MSGWTEEDAFKALLACGGLRNADVFDDVGLGEGGGESGEDENESRYR